jgi:hypothetical protein
VRPAEAVVIEQFAHLGVTGDQPGLIAYRGSNPMDGTGGPYRAQFTSRSQRMRLRERQLNGQDRFQAWLSVTGVRSV